MRYNYIGFHGEVVASTPTPYEWHWVPGGITFMGMRFGDWVASEHEVGQRPQEMRLPSQTFPSDGTFRVEMTMSES